MLLAGFNRVVIALLLPMRIKPAAIRYIVSATLSIALLQGIATSAPKELPALAQIHAKTVAVSLALISAPPPLTQNEPKQAEQTPPITPPPVEKPPVVEKAIAKKTAVKKPIVKKEVVKKPRPKPIATKKVEKTKPEIKKPAVKPAPTAAKKPTNTAATKTAQSAKPTASQPAMPMLVSQPKFKIKPVSPSYPRAARRKGLEGEVLVEVWLDKNGKQLKRDIIKSSGVSSLDKAALSAIKKWQFNAYQDNGTAIAHRVHIPITFKLD